MSGLCEHCEVSNHPGILVGCGFDDRGISRSGCMWIMRCDDCQVYESDFDAADALGELTAWPIVHDWDNLVSAKPICRSYARVSMREVEAFP